MYYKSENKEILHFRASIFYLFLLCKKIISTILIFNLILGHINSTSKFTCTYTTTTTIIFSKILIIHNI